MLHVKDENTESPQVNWETKTANCICGVCQTEKTDFPLYVSVRFDGGNFIYMNTAFGCGCEYTTIYPLSETDPVGKILGRMAGFFPAE